ncbi:MAG: hypothetical protein J7K26_03495 [Candidatus Aenigmarchaeota archaeon]|nr:hypothetical protein [Candidatus Aenigmarchaeota archaeon]
MEKRDIKNVKENLRIYNNFEKIGISVDDAIKDSKNRFNRKVIEKRIGRFDGRDYNICTTLTIEPHFLKNSKYVRYINNFIGNIIRNKINIDYNKIKKGLYNHFAETGLILSFIDFCIQKKIDIIEYEPRFLNGYLDLKIGNGKEEVLVEAYAPIPKITISPALHPISKLVKNEIKKHKIYRTKKSVIILIMLNSSWWGGNNLNAGKISDFMFYPAKVCILSSKKIDDCISAVIIKKGNLFHLYNNPSAKYPLSASLINKMSNTNLITILYEKMRYYRKQRKANKRLYKILKKCPEEYKLIVNKGYNPKKFIKRYFDINNYSF